MNFIDELRWRGMIHNEDALIPGTAESLSGAGGKRLAGYIGFDPTGPSLHIGNLATVMMLVHFQRAGHHPIALVGGATAMVGDPSGKDAERPLLTRDEIQANQDGIRSQLTHFLDFDGVENPAQMVNNHDWFGQMGFLEFLRDVGKHVSINTMLQKESVKKRVESDAGISYTEFAYQLLQGYDYVHLFRHHACQVQMGGSDQWGNITAGVQLIRKLTGESGQAYAITCPLITRADGKKFGKTAGGKSVWLDPGMTSPFEFYQYWLNSSDDDAEKFIKVFTLLDREVIDALITTHREAPHQRQLQTALAEDVTRRVHGDTGLQNALALTQFLFARTLTPEALTDLSPELWAEAAASDDAKRLPATRLAGDGANIMDLLAELEITASKSEARRAITKDKSIHVNGTPCTDIDTTLTAADAIHGQYFLLQRGKKNRFIVAINADA